jgi:hypothetical protein
MAVSATQPDGATVDSDMEAGMAAGSAAAGGTAVADMAMAAESRRGFGGAMHQPLIVRLAMLTVLALAGGAMANAQQPQTNAPPPVPNPPPPSAQAAADQRINALQAQLRITSVQMLQWSAFAQAMRDNATSTDALFRQRAGTAATMTALENMRSYAQVARTYADNTEALAQAFETLYGVLTPEQQQTIDALFRQQPTQAATTQPYRR